MALGTSITLDDKFSAFVAAQIAAGRFESASEVVRAGLSLLLDSEAKCDSLDAALQAGEDSGPATPLNVREIIADCKRLSKIAA
jgi:antitoxin ParD1/3/4